MLIDYSSGQILARLNEKYKTLVSNVEFKIDSGESLALIGETGSGKTIIAYSIMKLLPSNVKASEIKIFFDGQDLSKRKSLHKLLGDEIVYIPQNGYENLSQSRKVKDQIFDSLKRINTPKQKMKETALIKLRAVGFSNPEEIMDKYPFELSGGMAQRVVIAIGICSNAKFVIADEPTNGLEDERKFEFLELIDSLFPNAAKLFITHDISIAKKCKEVIVLCNGKTMEKGKAIDVLEAPKSSYTRALINSLVENGMAETPIIREQRGNCPFYCRCKEANDKCLNNGGCQND